MKAVLLCRVSSKEQEEIGYSLPSQAKLLTEYAIRLGFTDYKVFPVSESASSKSQRKAFNDMMRYVEQNNIKIIICEKTDRFTRNLKDAVALYEWLDQDEERQLHLVKDNLVLHKNSRSQEKLNLDFRIVFAKNYIDNLSEEVKKGQKEKLEQGWRPAKPYLGYKNQEVNGHKTHIIDHKVAPLVIKAFELYDEGNYSIERLVDVMYELGLCSHNGNKVVTSKLHHLLSNPFYYGMILWNDKLYEGQHEPLIDKELFNRVQARMHGKNTPKIQKHLYLFKGLIKCSECGGTITWEQHKGHIYGHCNHYKPCTQKKWVREDRLELQLITALEKLQINNVRIMEWIRKTLHQSNNDIKQYQNLILDQLNNKLKSINKRISKLYDDKVDGVITVEFYTTKNAEYKKQENDVKSAIAKHINAGHKYRELGIQFYELSQRAKTIYKKILLEKKRVLFNLMFAKFTLNNGNLEYEYTKGFMILERLVKLTNESTKVIKYVRQENNTFEQDKKIDTTVQIADFGFLNSDLRRGWDDVGTYFTGFPSLVNL
jgi:DNA invertase Pin-like site-specific DNA recombinase